MKGRHHLERRQIRKNGRPNRRRRRDRFHSLELVLRVNPTSAAFVDLFNGRRMIKPSFVELTTGDRVPSEVVVVLATDPSHRLLEAGELVFQILHGMVKDVQLRRLLAHQHPKIIGLEERGLFYIAN